MERKLTSWIFILTIFVVVFALYPNNRSSILTKEFGYVVTSGALALVLAGAVIAGRKVNARIGLPLLLSFALFVGWMVFRHFTGTRSVNGPVVIYAFAALGLTAGVGGLLMGPKERDTVLWGLIAATVLLCIYTMLQWMNVTLFPWDVYLGSSGRLSGSLGNPNLLGSYMASIIPVGVAFLLTRPLRLQVRIASASAFAILCLLCIISSGTRGSILGLIGGIGILGLILTVRHRGAGLRRFLPLGIAAAGIISILFFMRTRFIELANPEHGTARVRLVIWTGTLHMFADNPLLGWGPGSFQIVFPRYRNPRYSMLGTSHNTEHAHSEYLELLTDEGLVGVALLGLLAWQVIRAARRRGSDLLTLGLLAGCISLVLESSVSVSLRWPPSAYLLTLFVTFLLVGARDSERRIGRAWALPLLAAAVVVGRMEAPGYVRAMASGHLLFIGKDLYLDKIETDLNLAGNDAIAWEQTNDPQRRILALSRCDEASALCDSSISWLQRCVSLNPSELGGWYGLGSAWLTKAIIIQPTSQPLLRLLQNERGYVPSRDSIIKVTIRALAAYDSLRARAPDYAEVNNNLALAYTRLGLPAETMHALRRAYDLHAHRRADYLMQAASIGPLGGWFDATHFIWLAILDSVSGGLPGRSSKSGYALSSAQWFSGMAMASEPSRAESLAASLSEMSLASGYPSAASLPATLSAQAAYAAEGQRMVDLWMSGDTAGLAGRADSQMAAAGVVLPSQFLVRHLVGARRGESASVDSLLTFGRHLTFDGFLWLSMSPGGDAWLEVSIESSIAALSDSSGASSERPQLLRALAAALDMDNTLSKLVMIARSDFSEGVDPSVEAELERRWYELGGPQAAADQSLDVPWVDGSIFGDAMEALDRLVSERPGDMGLLGTRITADYEALSSFWWGPPRFTDSFRDYFLVAIAADRQKLGSLAGSDEAIYMSQALMQQVNSIVGSRISGDFAPFLERLRLDIVNNRVLGPEGGIPST